MKKMIRGLVVVVVVCLVAGLVQADKIDRNRNSNYRAVGYIVYILERYNTEKVNGNR